MILLNIQSLLIAKSLPPVKSWMSLEDIIHQLGTPDSLIKSLRVTEVRYGNYVLIFENRSQDLLEINNINPDPLNDPGKLSKLFFYKNDHFEVTIEDDILLLSHFPSFERIKFLLNKNGILFEIDKVRANQIHETLFLKHSNGLLLEFISLHYNYTDPYPLGKPYYKKELATSEDDFVLTAIRF